MSLPTAELGTTGMELTRVGFGAWAIGGGDWAAAWGPQDDDESVAAIQHAIASGINWIDTAVVRRDVETSLRRLGVERIDLYQVHWPAEDGTPLEEYWQVMVDLRSEG